MVFGRGLPCPSSNSSRLGNTSPPRILFQRRSLAGGSLVQLFEAWEYIFPPHSIPTTFFGRGLPCPSSNSSRLGNTSFPRILFQRRSLAGGSLVQVPTLRGLGIHLLLTLSSNNDLWQGAPLSKFQLFEAWEHIFSSHSLYDGTGLSHHVAQREPRSRSFR
jgi:hypothetical protein